MLGVVPNGPAGDFNLIPEVYSEDVSGNCKTSRPEIVLGAPLCLHSSSVKKQRPRTINSRTAQFR